MGYIGKPVGPSNGSDLAYDNTSSGLISTHVSAALDEIIAQKGVALGTATLDSEGLVPSSQLPSYVDDVLEVEAYVGLPTTGETGKVYIVVADEMSGGNTSSYRWTGSVYAMVSNTLTAADIEALYEGLTNTNKYTDTDNTKVGKISITQLVDLDQIETDVTANNAKITNTPTDLAYDTSTMIVSSSDGTGATLTVVDAINNGLMLVADKTKLDVTETTTQLNARDVVSKNTDNHTDGTTNGVYTLVERAKVDADTTLTTTSTTLPTAVNELVSVKVDKIANSSLVLDSKVVAYNEHIIDSTNPHSVTQSQVGLSAVDNTSDVNKPVSLAGQTALDTKQNVLLEGIFTDGDKTKLDDIEVAATADQTKDDIDALGINSATVNNLTIETAVPAGAVFTDTVYDSTPKADKVNVLELNNVTQFIPTTDYHPATKKYADEVPVNDSDVIFTDNTTGNFNIVKHGFVPKGTNLGYFLRDDGQWVSNAPQQLVSSVVSLESAGNFAILAQGTVTNAGSSSVTGDVGAIGAISGFSSISGSLHQNNVTAIQAMSDLDTAHTYLTSLTSTKTHSATYATGEILSSGIYSNTGAVTFTGEVTLDGEGDPNAIFVFQFGAAATWDAGAKIKLVNSANVVNVYFVSVGTITVGAGSSIVGNYISQSTVTLGAGSYINGGLYSTASTVTVNSSIVLSTLTIQQTQDTVYDGIFYKQFSSNNKTKLDLISVTGATDLDATVKTVENQTIAGTKTFISSPVVPTPTSGLEAVNKDYVDLQGTSGVTSIPTSRMLTNGISLSNTVNQLTFDAITYTGNGTTQVITTGMSTIDFTVASNGTGFYHYRATGDCVVRNDAGTIIESGSISFMNITGIDGLCQVHLKSRSTPTSNFVFDGLRGVQEEINTDSTAIEATLANSLTAFTTAGFTIGNAAGINVNTETYVSYITLYTHIKWGLTNQGKRYIEAFNPMTNDTMIMYQGSGVVGHEIPQSTGVKLDYSSIKNLSNAMNWEGTALDIYRANVNSSDRLDNDPLIINMSADYVNLSVYTANINQLNSSLILYGKAKSKTWTIVEYTGTGVAGNFVETIDVDGVSRRPRRVIIKKVDGTGDWLLFDSARGDNGIYSYAFYLNLATTDVADTNRDIKYLQNGFIIETSSYSHINGNGGKYIALVEFDTNSTGTSGSYVDLPSSTSNVQMTDTTLLYSTFDNGYKQTKETFAGTTTMIPSNGWEN